MTTTRKTAAAIAIAAVLLALPLVVGDSWYINLASQILIASIYALSLNLLVGYAGLTSLGHAIYFATTAYLFGWFTTTSGLGLLAGAGAAVGVTVVLAGVCGLIALRASGLGFLMITLALGQIFWGIAYRWVNLTGGDNGMSGLARPAPFGIDLTAPGRFYAFTVVVFVACFLVFARLVQSPFGACLRGTRDQPRRMAALGHWVWLVRWLAFVQAGFGGAVAGLMYAYYQGFISPHALSLTSSAEVLLMVIAGGAGTLLGPVVGAALVLVLKNVVSAYVERWLMLLGFVFVLIVVFMPDGIVPSVERWWARRRSRPPPRHAQATAEPAARLHAASAKPQGRPDGTAAATRGGTP